MRFPVHGGKATRAGVYLFWGVRAAVRLFDIRQHLIRTIQDHVRRDRNKPKVEPHKARKAILPVAKRKPKSVNH
jgi:hypothetical protein